MLRGLLEPSWYQNSTTIRGPWKGRSHHVGGVRRRSSRGLAVAVQTRPYDAPDSASEQDGEGHVRADEGSGEERGHKVKGGRRGMGQRGEEADEGTGESREHEGGEAERPDAGAGLSVGHACFIRALVIAYGDQFVR